MKPDVQNAIRAMLKAFDGITDDERSRLLAALRTGGREQVNPAVVNRPDRILRRAEVASRLGCSTRAVDKWANEGKLVRFCPRGFRRALGYRESDIAAFIENRQGDKACA